MVSILESCPWCPFTLCFSHSDHYEVDTKTNPEPNMQRNIYISKEQTSHVLIPEA